MSAENRPRARGAAFRAASIACGAGARRVAGALLAADAWSRDAARRILTVVAAGALLLAYSQFQDLFRIVSSSGVVLDAPGAVRDGHRPARLGARRGRPSPPARRRRARPGLGPAAARPGASVCAGRDRARDHARLRPARCHLGGPHRQPARSSARPSPAVGLLARARGRRWRCWSAGTRRWPLVLRPSRATRRAVRAGAVAPLALPAVVGEGLVGLRHAVDVVLALVGVALLLRRVQQLVREPLAPSTSRAAGARTRPASARPACGPGGRAPRPAPGRWRRRRGGSGPRAPGVSALIDCSSASTGSLPLLRPRISSDS